MSHPIAARYGGPRQIALTEQPRLAPAPGEVVLEVEVCGICGTDLHFFAGQWPQPSVTPGHEFAGVIRETGDWCDGWTAGDRVVVEPGVGCGGCRFCRSGETNLCPEYRFLSLHSDGGFASSVVVPVGCLHRVPAGMAPGLAALAEPLAVAVHACRTAGTAAGDTVLVCGAGSIGLLTIAAAVASGAVSVICLARHPHQKAAAAELGAHPVSAEDLEATVRERTGGAGADIAIETIGGAGQTVGTALGTVRPGGSIVLVGGFTRPTSLLLSRVVGREIRILGSSFYSRKESPTDFELALAMLSRAELPFSHLLTHRYRLDAIEEAFLTASDKSSGAIKVQVDCGGQAAVPG